MRPVPILFLCLATPLGAQTPAPAKQAGPPVPQPIVLDWTGQFRLYAPPNNVDQARLKAAEAAVEAHRRSGPSMPPSRAAAALKVDDHSTTRTSYRRLEEEEPTLNLQAPVESGPVSVGASYGKYRVVPDTNGVSSQDVRVSLGVAF